MTFHLRSSVFLYVYSSYLTPLYKLNTHIADKYMSKYSFEHYYLIVVSFISRNCEHCIFFRLENTKYFYNESCNFLLLIEVT